MDEAEELLYESGADCYVRCPHHPSEIISNGMFDAPCGGCEAAMDDFREPDPITDEQRAAIDKMMAENDACENCGRKCHGDRGMSFGLYRCRPGRNPSDKEWGQLVRETPVDVYYEKGVLPPIDEDDIPF